MLIKYQKKLEKLGQMSGESNKSNVIKMATPLIVTKDEIDEGVGMMDKALEAADAYVEE